MDNPQPNQPVWAQFGSVGWCAAIVERVTPSRVIVLFPDRPRSYRVRDMGECRMKRGARLRCELRPRDPGQQGQDKPKPVINPNADRNRWGGVPKRGETQ